MRIADLPLVNACINTVVAVLLFVGWVLIRQKRREAHRWVMLSALSLSALFLASYVTYHLNHGSTKFTGQGPIRYLYFAILISHTILAIVNLPFVIITVVRAFQGEFARHAAVAKRTWAIWMYVAITGPIVYWMLYRLDLPAAPASAAVAAPSSEAEQRFLEARGQHRAGRDREALAGYGAAAALGHGPAACYAAVLGDRLEGTNTASAALARARAADPLEPHCATLWARERVHARAAEEAIPVLERVVGDHPHDAFFWSSLGYARFTALRYEEAATAFEKSAALDPALKTELFNAGYAHFLAGRYSKAKPLLERALTLGLEPEVEARAKEELAVIAGSLWICPMHPSVTGKPGEKCPDCGMPLEVAPHGLAEGRDVD